MRPVKNLFSGSLGKLQNIGGSKFFTTPHTVQVPTEYEINSGSQGEFLTCSLDGRLWLFSDRLIALKWNANTSRMEFAKSLQVNVESFIARGIDWILTGNSFFQVLDDAPYIFSESVSFNESLNVDAFYSFLPAIDGWQIVNNFLVRRYGNDDEAPLHSLSIPTGLYLTHLEQGIYGKDSSYIGSVSIEDYQLVIAQDYSTVANVSGLAFLDKTLYGFRLKQDSSLCPVSADTLLFNAQAGSWSNVFDGQDTSGNIFFDPFNCKALAVRDDVVNLLPEKKIFSAKGLSQWFASTKNIASVTSDFVITQLEHDILVTHVNSGLYREILHQKDLALTCRGYSDYKLAIGEINNVLRLNKTVYKIKTQNIRLLNVFEHEYISPVSEEHYNYDFYSQVPVYYEVQTVYSGKDYRTLWGDHAQDFTGTQLMWGGSLDDDGIPHHMICEIATVKFFFIDPVTGNPENVIFTINPHNEENASPHYVKYAEHPRRIFVLGDKLICENLTYTFVETPDSFDYEVAYKYILISDSSCFNFQRFSVSASEREGKQIQEFFNINLQLMDINISSAEATFKDNNTNTTIVINIPPENFNNINNKWDKSLGDLDLRVQDYININNSNETLHVAIYTYPIENATYGHSFFVFKSEL